MFNSCAFEFLRAMRRVHIEDGHQISGDALKLGHFDRRIVNSPSGLDLCGDLSGSRQDGVWSLVGISNVSYDIRSVCLLSPIELANDQRNA
jgi:hypothetical protein